MKEKMREENVCHSPQEEWGNITVNIHRKTNVVVHWELAFLKSC